MSFSNLSIRAGQNARKLLAREGLSLDRVRVLAGASGGAKWLVLSQMDKVLAQHLQGRARPLQCIGSSIGSWRMAALAQPDPIKAIEDFEVAYVNQRYEEKPSTSEVDAETRRILDDYLHHDNYSAALRHPFMALGIIANRVRGSENHAHHRFTLGARIAAAGVANTFQRDWMGRFFERTVFVSDAFDRRVFNPQPFATDYVALNDTNFKDALIASGSIPFLMGGVRDIAGARPGLYLDGGMIDYHLDLEYQLPDDELVLMLHFYPHITPGWFDKSLPWRHANPAHLDNVVVISPSAEFVAGLPGGQIPDRRDFKTFFQRDDERIDRWNEVLEKCKVLAGEFEGLLGMGSVETELL